METLSNIEKRDIKMYFVQQMSCFAQKNDLIISTFSNLFSFNRATNYASD